MKTKFIAIAAMTLDGKIAKSKDHLSTEWTSEEDKNFFRKLLKTCDAILIGNNTFQTAKGPLSKRNCIVLTRSVDGIKKENNHLTFINTDTSDLKKFIADQHYQNVAILGGAQVYSYCLANGMIDELYLTVEPIVFGQGIDLFTNFFPSPVEERAEVRSKDARFQLASVEKLNEKGTLLIKYKYDG